MLVAVKASHCMVTFCYDSSVLATAYVLHTVNVNIKANLARRHTQSNKIKILCKQKRYVTSERTVATNQHYTQWF
jgi:hypothetical protein